MKLILNGGGSNKQVIESYNKLKELVNNNKPILYIPLAMEESIYSLDSCYLWIKSELKDYFNNDIVMIRSFNELNNINLNNYSFIFIGGGNTYKLLNGLKEYNNFNIIKDYINNNGIIFGGSAGASIFGKDINIISIFDDNNVNLIDTKGFNVLNNISIFPHYKEEYNDYLINYSIKEGKVYAIPEEDSIIIEDNYINIIGSLPYCIIENGNINIIPIK